MDFTPTQAQLLLNHARAVIVRRLERLAPPPPLHDEFAQASAGCFVTLHSLAAHRLRGCIGRIRSEHSLALTLEEMAQAALEDSRFEASPITPVELPELEVEITVLSPLEETRDPLDFDLHNHGIYLQHSGRSGCFLPQVARETGWDRQTLLQRLCTEKMGLHAGAWRERGARLHRFTTTIIGPEPLVPPGIDVAARYSR